MTLSEFQPYREPVERVLAQYLTTEQGLSENEAKKRLEQNGENALVALKNDPLWKRYLQQFRDWMILLLVASSVLSVYLGDLRTAVVLAVLVLFNITIGFLQEYHAEKTMKALEKLVKPFAEVYRNGKLTEIESRLLVPGDVIRLAEGDSIPADVRLIETAAFSTNDFALTGESDPTMKFTHAIGDAVPTPNRHNLAFMGTTVATGEAYGVVIATGMHTELGRIADLSQSTRHSLSPLQREIRHIATLVTYGVAILSAILLMLAIVFDMAIKDAVLFAIGFASALVPQGLPAEVNTSLAQAAGKLARVKALVKKLSAVESLGATQIICTDKTGTLTKNEMTVISAIIGTTPYQLTGTGYEPKGQILQNDTTPDAAEMRLVQQFFATGLYASNAKILSPDEHSNVWYCLGDPTEGALVTAALKAGVPSDAEPELLRELPFDSARKRMTSIYAAKNGAIAHVKGAPESILERATRIRVDGKIRPLTPADRKRFLKEHASRAEQALRNLAFATRTLSTKDARSLLPDAIEFNLVLEGLVSMVDPLRDNVPEAMQLARKAHIAVNIVTGDYAPTALAIARQACLVDDPATLTIVGGEQLQHLSDSEVIAATRRGGTIFSRVSPEDKMRIVGLVKEAGCIVAVTGDGINDAPALKRADIGVAMGVTGTDVAKQASEIILLDDSFDTLVQAIREGRTIFVNIKKGVLSCFTSNAAETIVNLGGLALVGVAGIPLPLNVLQLLAIDLLAELFPIAALGWDKEEGETMNQPPRNQKDHILNRRSILDIIWCGVLIGGLALCNYLFFYGRHGVDPAAAPEALVFSATTMTYATIVICQLLNIMQRRSTHGFFSRYQFSNAYFWGALTLSALIILSIAYLPTVSTFFKSGPLGVVDWLFVIGAGALFIAIRELQRVMRTGSFRTTPAGLAPQHT